MSEELVDLFNFSANISTTEESEEVVSHNNNNHDSLATTTEGEVNKPIDEEEDTIMAYHEIMKEEFEANDVRIAMIGNVDSGKSTLIGVLTNASLDDGRGAARATVLKHRHEQENGRTSVRFHNVLYVFYFHSHTQYSHIYTYTRIYAIIGMYRRDHGI